MKNQKLSNTVTRVYLVQFVLGGSHKVAQIAAVQRVDHQGHALNVENSVGARDGRLQKSAHRL